MTPPERIWLQWHGDAEEWEDGEIDPGDASWAPHKVWERDVEYVRVDHKVEKHLQYWEIYCSCLEDQLDSAGLKAAQAQADRASNP